MFRIITLNLNGIRSAGRKGFFTWVMQQNADIICLQELKAQEVDLQHKLFQLAGYQAFFHFAEKKGYSGVAIYTRHAPHSVKTGLGWGCADQEGRYVAVNLGKLWVASLYMPSGTTGDHRQKIKYEFLEYYASYLQQLNREGVQFIIAGDFNIAHQNIDLKNWRQNQKNSGFLPDERAWLTSLFDEIGYVDAFRVVNQAPGLYTWWSNRGRAREKNVGWRIDYQITSPQLKPYIKSAFIYTTEIFSDHAPLIIDYDLFL